MSIVQASTSLGTLDLARWSAIDEHWKTMNDADAFWSLWFELVVVRFRAVGNAPILKQNMYKITASNKFLAVIQFLRKELNYKHSDPLVNHEKRPQ